MGSKGSSDNHKHHKAANDNTDTKVAFTQPEPDRSNNKAEPRSSSQPTYSCIDGMCSMDGEQLWSNKEAGYTAQDSAKATRISDNHDYTTNAGDDNANRAGDLKYEEFKRRELSKWQWELYEHHVNNNVNNNILENPYTIEYNLYNDELLDDYLRGAYARYQKEGDFTTSPFGLMLHTTGSGIKEFKRENPKTAQFIRDAIDEVEKALGYAIDPYLKMNSEFADLFYDATIGKEAKENLYRKENEFWKDVHSKYESSFTDEQKEAFKTILEASGIAGTGKLIKEGATVAFKKGTHHLHKNDIPTQA
ncbi:hypothetical protein I862_01950 [endosymbiont of Acanthamoeba sp. UWC8]|uniref:hypothetical protein n=1 Tax=endosymbiont of Acanthamoeba sp. UWC8 TaxID=86106 RepID=UPI0004D15F30|nr:hypothetical protein [endosymbiont of Acanthamoeba sp. UWC8]AIF80953.1 hypothetical protein I862_01950 [endosymbiont of Acanthamoeba sp. UWC8]